MASLCCQGCNYICFQVCVLKLLQCKLSRTFFHFLLSNASSAGVFVDTGRSGIVCCSCSCCKLTASFSFSFCLSFFFFLKREWRRRITRMSNYRHEFNADELSIYRSVSSQRFCKKEHQNSTQYSITEQCNTVIKIRLFLLKVK